MAYAFRAGDSANVISYQYDEDWRQEPGQVEYNPDLPRVITMDWPTTGMPGMTVYPSFPYPENRFVHSDAIAYAGRLASSVLTTFPDFEGTGRFGGIAKMRLYAEIARSRTLTLVVRNHDWIEAGDPFTFDGEDLVPVTDDITWVTLDAHSRSEQGQIMTTLKGMCTDIIGTMTRGG